MLKLLRPIRDRIFLNFISNQSLPTTKRGSMRRDVLIFGILMLVAALAFVFDPGTPTTGAAMGETYAYALDDFSRQFYGVHVIQFPEHACGQLAHSYLNNIFYQPLSVYEELEAKADGERAKTLMFGIEEQTAGALEMIHGNELVCKDYTDFLGLMVHRGVRVPRLERDAILEVLAFGRTENQVFKIEKGRFRTAMLECEFDLMGCDCQNKITYDYGADEIRVLSELIED